MTGSLMTRSLVTGSLVTAALDGSISKRCAQSLQRQVAEES